MKEGSPKTDTFMHVSSARHGEKTESIPTDQRMTKYSDRRDLPLDGERIDPHRRNRQNEIWKNNRDVEKQRNNHQQKQPQDRPLSPETWRKPVDHHANKPASPDAPPVRYGKAASAVELAQAFSKSVSDPTVADRFSGLRGIPSRSQVPFSRLTGPTSRPQINGY